MRAKYGNRKCVYRGLTFDSVLERDRWIVLESRQAAGDIIGLQRQVEYDLEVNGKLICSIRPDFRYWVKDGMRLVIEDSKGIVTPDWKIKSKLFEALHGIPINIITKQNIHAAS